jgi:hypothetical protein
VLCLLLRAATGESCYVLAVLPTSAVVYLMLRDMPDHAMLCGHLLLCAVLVAVCSYWRELSSELQLRQGGALSIAEILNRMRDGAQLKLQATERELCLTLNALAGQLTAAADEAQAAAAADEEQQQQRNAGGGSSSSKKGRKRGRRSKAAAAADEPAAASDGDASEDDTAWAPGSSDRAAAAAAGGGGGGGSSSHQRPKKRVRFAAAAAVAAAGDEDEDGAAAEETGEAAAAAASGAGGGSSSSRRVSAAAGDVEAESPDELRRAALQLLEDSYKVREWLHVCVYAQQNVCMHVGHVDLGCTSALTASAVCACTFAVLQVGEHGIGALLRTPNSSKAHRSVQALLTRTAAAAAAAASTGWRAWHRRAAACSQQQ